MWSSRRHQVLIQPKHQHLIIIMHDFREILAGTGGLMVLAASFGHDDSVGLGRGVNLTSYSLRLMLNRESDYERVRALAAEHVDVIVIDSAQGDSTFQVHSLRIMPQISVRLEKGGTEEIFRRKQ